MIGYVADTGSFVLSSVDKDITIDVEFVEIPIYLSIKDSDNGYVKLLVQKGQQFTFVIEANEDWEIESVNFNGSDVTSKLIDNTFVTPAITSDSELITVYKQSNQTSVKAISYQSNIKVVAYGDNVVITNDGQEAAAAVYNTKGQLVKSTIAAFGTTTIALQPNNIYIIKVADQTYKVAL